jgi:hypothetical protein
LTLRNMEMYSYHGGRYFREGAKPPLISTPPLP